MGIPEGKLSTETSGRLVSWTVACTPPGFTGTHTALSMCHTYARALNKSQTSESIYGSILQTSEISQLVFLSVVMQY